MDASPTPIRVDQVAEQIRDLLFSGKFNSMFSLLFGVGFTLQFARMQARAPQAATRLYLRRLPALLALGLVHACVFWTGDVLHVYAVVGLLLVQGLGRVSDRTLLILAAACLVYPLVSGLTYLRIVTPEITAEMVRKSQDFEASNNAACGAGTFLQAAAEPAPEMRASYPDPWRLWRSLGFWIRMALIMILGLLVGRHRWAERVPEQMPAIRRLHRWTLLLGPASGVTYTVIRDLQRFPGPTPLKLVAGLAYGIGRLSMMAFLVPALAPALPGPAAVPPRRAPRARAGSESRGRAPVRRAAALW